MIINFSTMGSKKDALGLYKPGASFFTYYPNLAKSTIILIGSFLSAAIVRALFLKTSLCFSSSIFSNVIIGLFIHTLFLTSYRCHLFKSINPNNFTVNPYIDIESALHAFRGFTKSFSRSFIVSPM